MGGPGERRQRATSQRHRRRRARHIGPEQTLRQRVRVAVEDHRIGRQHTPVGELDAAGAAVAHDDALDRLAEMQRRTARACQLRQRAAARANHRAATTRRFVRHARSASAWPAPATATRRNRWHNGRRAGAAAGRGSVCPAASTGSRRARARRAWPAHRGRGRGSCPAHWAAPSGCAGLRVVRRCGALRRRRSGNAGPRQGRETARWHLQRPASRQTDRAAAACRVRRHARHDAPAPTRAADSPAIPASCRPDRGSGRRPSAS